MKIDIKVVAAADYYCTLDDENYDSKEELLKAAESLAMLNLEKLDNYYIIGSEII